MDYYRVCSTSAKLAGRMSPVMTYACHACSECRGATIAAVEALNDLAMEETVVSLRRCQPSCDEMGMAMGGAHEPSHAAPR